jgi:Cu(I)/Ag(I) efflux system protein CusF
MHMSLRSCFTVVIALLGAGASSFGLAQMDHGSHGTPAPKSATAEGVMEHGTVKKVDKAGGKVSIAHEAQKGGMPAMTMIYKIKDMAVLDKLQVGQKIRFATASSDSTTVVRVEPAK